jgi:DNA adenine methylase
MDNLLSPLRYPGGKSELTKYFEVTLKENLLLGCHLVEPYAGGGSVSLAMLTSHLIRKATLIERDPLIYSFWKSVRYHAEELCDRIQRCDVTLNTWKKYQKYLVANSIRLFPVVELGMAGLFLNRTNFSGIITAGPIGGMSQQSNYQIDCRFNKERIIDLITSISILGPKINVVFGDGLAYLRRNEARLLEEHALAYLDPPYYQQGHRLYRFSYTKDDHKKLANQITKAKYPWIVSYDNHPYIKKLFAGQKILPISLNYAVKESRRADELLISNIKLAKPVYETKPLTRSKILAQRKNDKELRRRVGS